MSKTSLLLFSLIPLLLLLWGGYYFFQRETPIAKDEYPSRNDLLRNVNRDKSPIMVYGTGSPLIAQQYRDFLQKLNEQNPWWNFEYIPDSTFSLSQSEDRAVYAIGSLASNSFLREIASELPFKVQSDQIEINGEIFNDPNDIFSLLYPNPQNKKTPLYLFVANNDDSLLELQELPIRGDYQILRNGQPLVFGLFSQETGKRWTYSEALHRSFQFSDSPIASSKIVSIFAQQSGAYTDAQIQTVQKEIEHRMNRVKEFVGASTEKDLMQLELHLYPSFEDKGFITNQSNFVHNAFSELPRRRRRDPAPKALPLNQVHVLYNDTFDYINGYQDVQAQLRYLLGSPKHTALEIGLSLTFTDKWHQMPYLFWASRLYHSESAPPLSELFDEELFQQESDIIFPAMAGSFVAFLLDKSGKEQFLNNYQNWSPTAKELEQLEPDWHTFLQGQYEQYKQAIQVYKQNFPKPVSFHKAFNFAHEGYQVYNGYGSLLATQSMEKIKALGGNSLALIPYSFMRNPKEPFYLRFARGAHDENDLGVITTHLEAQKLGMSVMLKPQVWISNSWPGEVEMQSAKDWNLFFDYYFRWIRHYAILAEMYQMEILCVQTEMSKTTKHHEEKWIEIIDKLRGVYSGQMTVAANWDEGFDSKQFWNKLDFMGINAYRTLSEKDNPTDAELLQGAQEVVSFFRNLSQKFKKPIIFTEIGFTSTPKAWYRPYEYAHGKPVDLEAQVRCYQAMLQALEGETWHQGYYWWKWPSYMDWSGTSSPDFAPAGKPTENVVQEWFSK